MRKNALGETKNDGWIREKQYSFYIINKKAKIIKNQKKKVFLKKFKKTLDKSLPLVYYMYRRL